MARFFQNRRQLVLTFYKLETFQIWNSLDELLERQINIGTLLRMRILTAGIRCAPIVNSRLL